MTLLKTNLETFTQLFRSRGIEVESSYHLETGHTFLHVGDSVFIFRSNGSLRTVEYVNVEDW